MQLLHKSNSSDETKRIGEGIGKEIKDGGIVCLFGNLGSGKTTLTQGIAKGLGVEQNIVSPTFILMRRYEIGDRFLFHIDLYRLNNIEEVKGLGIEEILEDPKNIVIIEWPEKIIDALPRRRREIRISSLSETEREILYETLP